MENLLMKAQVRDKKLKAGKLRKKEIIPAVIYNHGKSDSIQIENAEIKKLFAHGVSESTLIDIEWDGKKETAFIKEYQVHPITGNVEHIDFFRITYGEKIKTRIPIELKGKPIGVREGGVLETFLHEIEVETFPRYLVPFIEVDISGLKIGDSIHVDAVTLPPESKCLNEGNPIICNVSISAKAKGEELEETGTEAPAKEEKQENKKE
ncbi:MAG: 50S ribosomal protein L25 [Spirochaetia bacterium]|nr:50S ribosomal protein L25 [Spirochaetia bacterium]